MYILASMPFEGYFSGKTYKDAHSNELYAVATNKVSEAEKYTHRESAIFACNTLNKNIQNYVFTVIDDSIKDFIEN